MKFIAMAILAMTLGIGCQKLREEVNPKIAEILKNPRNFDGKDVRVTGTVTDAFSVYRAGYFRISDGSGTIAVVTSQISPRQGDQIEAHGVVEQAYTIGSNQMLVIVERSPRVEASKVTK
jgi:cytochrome c-type biogenesis protein CcmE